MIKSRLLVGAIVALVIGASAALLSATQAHAATIANSNLTNLSDARSYVRANRNGFITYVKGNVVLYHDNATGGWRTTTLPGTVLTRNNDGSSDERNACVDINDRGFAFDTDIWANRGFGCGSNGSTTSGYSGGRVNVNPPNGVPIFLFIEDVDGLNERQHITFTSSAIQYLYTPRTRPAFDVRGGDDLVSNGDYVTCTGQANCNAIVLLLADSFNIKAGSKDGNSVMSVKNNTPYSYRTLTFDPQGGTFPSDQLGREDGESKLIREYADGVNLVRDLIRGEESNEFPQPTKSGYIFQGWYEDPSGTGTRRTSWSMTADKTLYAVWGPASTDPYTLTPTVTVMGSTTINPGQSATFAPGVGKAGTIDASNIHWELAKIIVPAGGSIDTSLYSSPGSASVCAHYAPLTCTLVQQANNETFSATTTPLPTVTDADTAGLVVGSRLCYALLVSPYTDTGGNYSQAISCVVVATLPTVQVWGNDLRVGSTFSNDSNVNSIVTGAVTSEGASWVEYAITAPSSVSRIGSQSGASNGGSSNPSDWSKLTFSNATNPCSSGGYGCFTAPDNMGKIPSLAGALRTLGGGIVRYDGTLPILSSAIAPWVGGSLTNVTQSAVVITTDKITITNDIIYTPASLGNNWNIPQLILIARDIDIAPNVTRVDAWLVANGGTINTCTHTGTLTSNDCTVPLRLNGPLMATQLALNRTYHNAAQPTDAAEIINLRSDAYIWAHNQASQNGSWQTVYTTELPPRY